MGKKKIVIDTNILISALGWGGKPKKLLDGVIMSKYELYLSVKQIKELQRVLEYPRFGFTEQQKTQFLDILFEISHIIDTKLQLKVIVEDPSDNMFLECAVEADADYIISGDHHLKQLQKFGTIRIVSAAEFLEKT